MMLQVEEVHGYYGKSHILQGVSLQVGAGEVVTLLDAMAPARPPP